MRDGRWVGIFAKEVLIRRECECENFKNELRSF